MIVQARPKLLEWARERASLAPAEFATMVGTKAKPAPIEDDALASAVRRMAESGGCTGTAREMLDALNMQEGVTGPKDRAEGWPASADALGRRFRKLAPVLREVGIKVRQKRTAKARGWAVAARKLQEASQVSQASCDDPFEPEDGGLACATSNDTLKGVLGKT
jgi:hypothetical protein